VYVRHTLKLFTILTVNFPITIVLVTLPRDQSAFIHPPLYRSKKYFNNDILWTTC